MRSRTMRILLHWLINAAALFMLPYVFKWVQVESVGAALIAALVLGLINALVRPLLFVLNGLLFWAVGSLVPGFRVTGFWAGVFGAIVYSLISWALAALLMPNDHRRTTR